MFVRLETETHFHGLKSSFACHFFLSPGQRCSCTGGNCGIVLEMTRGNQKNSLLQGRSSHHRVVYVFCSCLQLWYMAVHHQETAAQSPKLDGFGAFLFLVTPDRCLAWISEGLRDQGKLPAIQQAPKHKC